MVLGLEGAVCHQPTSSWPGVGEALILSSTAPHFDSLVSRCGGFGNNGWPPIIPECPLSPCSLHSSVGQFWPEDLEEGQPLQNIQKGEKGRGKERAEGCSPLSNPPSRRLEKLLPESQVEVLQ